MSHSAGMEINKARSPMAPRFQAGPVDFGGKCLMAYATN